MGNDAANDVLVVRGVRKTYEAENAPVRALRGCDLDLATGDFAAVMGPSGCGKSTLLNLVAGLDTADEGSIILAGEEVTDRTEDELARLRRRHIGIVFQFFNLLESMSVLENVALPAIVGGMKRKPAERRARDLLDLLGLGDKGKAVPGVLSGGQRQRLAIARRPRQLADDRAGRRADRRPRYRRRHRGARAVPPPPRRRADDLDGHPQPGGGGRRASTRSTCVTAVSSTTAGAVPAGSRRRLRAPCERADMDALRYLIRTTLDRRGVRGALVLALVIGLATGAGFAGLAGARRTSSAYERYLRDANASDLEVDVFSTEFNAPSIGDAAFQLTTAAGAESLPGVVATESYFGLESAAVLVDGEVGDDLEYEIVGSHDGRFFSMDRAVVTDGRLPAIDSDDEVLVTEPFAHTRRVGVGDELTIGAFPLSVLENFEPVEPEAVVTVRIVGIGLLPDEVLADEFDRFPRVLTPPQLTVRLAVARSYLWQGIRLAPGTDVDTVVAGYQEIVAERGDDLVLLVERTSSRLARVVRALEPTTVAVAIVAATALAAAVVLALLGSARLIAQAADTINPLRAMGVTPRTNALVIAAPAVLAVVAGTLIGVGFALAFSPLSPFGAVRAVEPNPGIDVDATVLGIGAIALLVVLLAGVAAAAGREQRRRGRAELSSGTGVIARLAAHLPVAAALGGRAALEPDRGRTGVPSRSTLLACVAAVTVMIGVLTYTTGLRALLDAPDRFGYSFDAFFSASAGYGFADPDTVAAVMADDPSVAAWSVAGFTQLDGPGGVVPAIATAGDDGIGPTVLRGRGPERPGEVALGAATARSLGVDVGDEVEFDGEPMAIVGLAALPAIGAFNSEHPSLGTGAWLALPESSANEDLAPNIVLVDYVDEVTPSVLRDISLALTSRVEGEVFGGYAPLRPAELVDGEETADTTSVLAGVLAVSALVAVAATVSTSVRRRRHDLAVLKTLGVGPRTAAASVHLQATAVVVVALVVGVPLGLAGGRFAWSRFAERTGVVPSSPWPWLTMAIVAVTLIVLVNAGVIGPAIRARRVRPAEVLRTT